MKHKLIFTTVTALAFSVSVLATPFTSPSQPSAKLIMNQPKEAKQLFQLFLTQVDGENINNRGGVVWMKPGEYDLSFAANIDYGLTRAQLGARTKLRANDLNQDMSITLEAGKTYYLAYDAKDTNKKNWKPVVYRMQ